MSQSRVSNLKPIPYPHQSQPLAYKYPETPDILYSTKKLQHINCIQQPTQQLGGLYLGDIISIVKPQLISKYQINAVLSCLHQSNYSSNLPSSVAKKTITAKDSIDYPINVHFQEAYEFIQGHRGNKKNVLVHCHAGVSRSATIVCAYLMKKCQWTFENAISFMKQRRNRVKPNQNFVKILKEYESLTSKQMPQRNQRNSINFTDIYYRPTHKPQNIRNSIQPQTNTRYLNSLDNNQDKPSNNNNNSNKKMNKSYFDLVNQFKTKSLTSKQTSLSMSFTMKNNKQFDDCQNRKQISMIKGQRNNLKIKKDAVPFGEQLKNKISSFIGRKPRIPWDLEQKKISCISYEENQISLSCF